MYKKLELKLHFALHIAFEQQDAVNEPKNVIAVVIPIESIAPIIIYIVL